MKFIIAYIKYSLISIYNKIKYNYFSNTSCTLTLGDIAKILNQEVPKRKNKNKKYFICYKNMMYMKNSVVFDEILSDNYSKKAVIKQHGIIISHKKEEYPCFVVENYKEAYQQLCNQCRRNDVTVVAVTGSTGKTTAKQFCNSVISQGKRVYCAKHNMNTYRFSGSLLQLLKNNTDCFIQEVDEGDPGVVGYASSYLKPNYAVVTNVGLSHSKNFGTQEDIRDNITEIEFGVLSSNGKIIYNYDDTLLRGYSWKANRISVSLENNNADCYCSNITFEPTGYISFTFNYIDIHEKLYISVPGLHNVYNAAYATLIGLEMGLTVKQIQKGLLKYKPSGVRQNLITNRNTTLYVDCFNAAPDSMKAALNTLNTINKGQAQAHRIAVLADMSEFGALSQKAHQEVGKYINNMSQIDYVFCYGKESKSIANEITNPDIKVVHTDNKKEISNLLKNFKSDNSIILFKGSRCMHLKSIIKDVFPKAYIKIFFSDVMLFHDI